MKNIKKSFIIVIIFIIIAFSLISQTVPKHSLSDIKQVKIAGVQLAVELALTVAQQEQGLSGRQGLNENEGMLFVFDHPDKYLFWMKDMNFAIDIIWITEDGSVIYIKKDARPELYPETYGPDENAKYILEVSTGFSDKNNLQAGDRVEFTY